MNAKVTEPPCLAPSGIAAVNAVRSKATWVAETSNDGSQPQDKDIQPLKQATEKMIEDIQQLLNGGTLDDAVSRRLNNALAKLQGALQGGTISWAALVAALAEAGTAINTANRHDGAMAPQQKMEQLLRGIEQDSKDIDDAFEKMRKAGIVFTKQDWEQRKQLRQYVSDHPGDIEAREALNAKEQAMIADAAPQIVHCPGAQEPFDEAKSKNANQQEKLREASATAEAIRKEYTINDGAWDGTALGSKKDVQGKDVTMNEVESQHFGQKQSVRGKTLS
jgi:hypothetical protein